MKVSLSFFLNFIIFISFGQTYKLYVDDSIKKVKIIQNEKISEDKLTADFRDVDFAGLSKLIIQEIVSEKKKKKNIVFIYETSANEQRMLINATDYVPTYNIENPVYNAKFFWEEEIIQQIVKKWRKNLVPALGYDVFLNKNIESKEAFYLSNRDMKFYELVVNQKAGKFIKKEGKYTSETELYYFQFDDKNLILQDDYNEKNYDVLNLSFRNKLGKIVVVKLNDKYKTYQYQNKKWVEIATIDEYKF